MRAVDVVADGEVARLRGELERLRAENVRLARLLDLRGRDTAPPPEQLSTAAATSGLVTMSAPVTDKLALYTNLFRARTDVYAVRWENARTSAIGWMPAVAGGWRKGTDRKAAAHLPLTAEVVAAHLVADVFIGLYPLLAGNTCHFLVAGFDGQAAMLDALAYVKAARASGVPAALEISQSGRGAHVWVFFTDAVPATVARSVGTVLVYEAMVLRGSMDLRSYDRLFPSQDVLPEGGFGNLIAAPLYGRRRKDGLTMFLDLAILEPYEDQWAFLSTLDRLTPGDASRIARRAKQAVVGTEVAAMSRSEATRVHPRLPAVVNAQLGAGLTLDASQLTAAALATFKHAASMANPKFYELQRLRKSTWDTPRFVRGYDLTLDDHLVLPRGLRHAVAAIIERAGSRLAVTDVRNPGCEIDVAFTAELDTRQSAAVSALLTHDDGVLVAPPGSGKTVMACAMIAERNTSTLVLVDRKALAEQWRTRIEQFLGIRPGQVGGGRRKLTGIIDIAIRLQHMRNQAQTNSSKRSRQKPDVVDLTFRNASKCPTLHSGKAAMRLRRAERFCRMPAPCLRRSPRYAPSSIRYSIAQAKGHGTHKTITGVEQQSVSPSMHHVGLVGLLWRAVWESALVNRPGSATSPYLLQHATNPLDWWQWGGDAFSEAKRRDVPVLISVGYSVPLMACHLKWSNPAW